MSANRTEKNEREADEIWEFLNSTPVSTPVKKATKTSSKKLSSTSNDAVDLNKHQVSKLVEEINRLKLEKTEMKNDHEKHLKQMNSRIDKLLKEIESLRATIDKISGGSMTTEMDVDGKAELTGNSKKELSKPTKRKKGTTTKVSKTNAVASEE